MIGGILIGGGRPPSPRSGYAYVARSFMDREHDFQFLAG